MMQRTTLDLARRVEELSRIAAPSGNEDRMTARVVEVLRATGVEPTVDRIGNVIARMAPGRDSIDLLLFAHLDELGLVVQRIEPDGFIRVERLGGVPEKALPGTPVVIHARNNDIPAVVGLKAHHLTPPEEKYVAQSVHGLYLDCGFASADQAQAFGLRIGDPVTYAPTFLRLAGGRIAGKSLDDRLGVAVLLELAATLAEGRPEIAVAIAFTVQEEFNVRGSLALAQKLQPSMAIGVDVAPATDTPDLGGSTGVCLGAGPVLTRLSFHGRGTLGGMIPHPAMLAGLEAAARDVEVAIQYQAIVGLITDAAFLPMATPDGIAAAEMAIPVRYTHSPVETAQVSDAEAAVRVLEAFTRRAKTLDLERGGRLARPGGMS